MDTGVTKAVWQAHECLHTSMVADTPPVNERLRLHSNHHKPQDRTYLGESGGYTAAV